MAKTNFSVTRDEVLRHVSYSPDSGEMRYLTGGFKRQAGDLIPPDRNVVNLLGSSYSKRKLIWFIQTGEWPSHKVNGIDQSGHDTRWSATKKGKVDKSAKLTAERLREVLSYDKETGAFVWLVGSSSTGLAGAVAGTSKSPDEYVKIRVDRRLYTAHRLAHLHVTGEWPPSLIDHEDHDKSNNAWGNLRVASVSQNGRNRAGPQINNKLGLRGVYWSKQNEKWGVTAVVNRKQYHGGFHDTPELAHAAAMELRSKLESQFPMASPR